MTFEPIAIDWPAGIAPHGGRGQPPPYFANLLLISGNSCLRDRVAVVPRILTV
jgi:hypothetical protein